MSDGVPRAWTCSCGRRVPGRVDQCRCGSKRPPQGQAAEGETDTSASEEARFSASAGQPHARTWLPGILLSLALAIALVVAAAVWHPWSTSPPSATVPTAETAPVAQQPAASDTAPEPVPFRVELPPDLQPHSAPLQPVHPAVAVLDGTVEEAAQRVIPAVVAIESDAGRGSGFFAPGSLILTNAHVVGSQGYVRLRLADGQAMSGHVLRTAPAIDLAVVRPERMSPGQTALPLRTVAEVRVGQEVLAVGSALGVLQNTVTRGIVSAVRNAGGVTLIQTDAAVNPGNSGGPLVDRQGWALGVTTMKVGGQAESLGFAVAADHARGLLEGRSDAAAQASGTLQDRLQSSMTGSRSTGSDRAREEATGELERQVTAIARAADRIDASWNSYRPNCMQTASIPRGYDREWFVLLDKVPQRSTSPACASWTDELVGAAAQVRQAMNTALEAARRAGVLPGDQREICRGYRLEWTGWQ